LLERDLQEFLFEHPDVLLPDEEIKEKSREFSVQGKRIDLLFRTEGTHYIVELKAVPLTREHIGQVIEYYGLMRDLMRDCRFKMILVSPSIPEFRRVFLEELGIRCVEIAEHVVDVKRLRNEAQVQCRREQVEHELEDRIPSPTSMRYDEIVGPVTKRSLAISHRFLRDSLLSIREAYSEYEVLPIRMARADSPDAICTAFPASVASPSQFVSGGVWWAYAFGASERMPKNDIPNVSAMAMPWGFDLAVNAELLTSQSVMRKRISENPSQFDELLRRHGGIHFHGILKLEHQPRFYHWITLSIAAPAECSSTFILEMYENFARSYRAERDAWIGWVERQKPDLSSAQRRHMRDRNSVPNLALRLVRPFGREDQYWDLPYEKQVALFVDECRRIKPLVDFLR
jgi:hypothetical protein